MILTRPLLGALCAAILAPPIAHRATHPDLAFYVPITQQTDREVGADGYTPVPSFPHIELVEEWVGTPRRELTALITDDALRQRVNKRKFKVLQVRDLNPHFGTTTTDGENFVIPFALSLKQYQDFLRQGTLNVRGRLTITPEGVIQSAVITEYFDSSIGERIGRMYWLHERDNLHFARVIGEPELVEFLKKKPELVEELLRGARAATQSPRS